MKFVKLLNKQEIRDMFSPLTYQTRLESGILLQILVIPLRKKKIITKCVKEFMFPNHMGIFGMKYVQETEKNSGCLHHPHFST